MFYFKSLICFGTIFASIFLSVLGDGYVCNGDLYQILSEGLYDTGRFYEKVKLVITCRFCKRKITIQILIIIIS